LFVLLNCVFLDLTVSKTRKQQKHCRKKLKKKILISQKPKVTFISFTRKMSISLTSAFFGTLECGIITSIIACTANFQNLHGQFCAPLWSLSSQQFFEWVMWLSTHFVIYKFFKKIFLVWFAGPGCSTVVSYQFEKAIFDKKQTISVCFYCRRYIYLYIFTYSLSCKYIIWQEQLKCSYTEYVASIPSKFCQIHSHWLLNMKPHPGWDATLKLYQLHLLSFCHDQYFSSLFQLQF